MDSFGYRRQIALAQMDTYLGVLLSWQAQAKGGYEDDDRPAGIQWIARVIPQMQDNPKRGWCCVRDTAIPGIGWECEAQFRVFSLCRSMRGAKWPLTRRMFRAAAEASNVSLPIRHVTLYMDEVKTDFGWRLPEDE